MSDGATLPLDAARARALYRGMLLIRRLEARAAERYTAGEIRGFLHLYDGEEAIAVGLLPGLLPGDAVVSNYREHGHALARGVSSRAVMAELYGKVEGCSHGRGGSMHLFDVSKRFYGGNAIVGAGLPVAVGFALAARLSRTKDVAVCLFGDGAVAEGEFHESLNLAALWKLPVLFVCENNLYAMGTAIARAQSEVDLVKKAASYGLVAERVDGMDVLAVEGIAAQLVAGMREGRGPAFLECRTYRFRPHSMFDSQLYRTKAEVEANKAERDPLPRFLARARAAGFLDAEEVRAIEQEVEAEVDDAVAFAEAGTLEPVADLLRDVSERREGARP